MTLTDGERTPASSGIALEFVSDFLVRSRTALYTQATLSTIFKDVPHRHLDTIIDVGSGSGFFLDACLRELRLSRGIAVRIEPDTSLIRAGLDVPRLQARGEALPLASGSVGLALCHFVLSRVKRKTASAIVREISRVLRPGGHALFLEPCLGLSTYHSPIDSNVGKLMAIARRSKAELHATEKDIDENFGLALPKEVGKALQVELVDLHLARWYTPFPSTDAEWAEIARERARDLERRDPVKDFLNAHGSGNDPIVAQGPSLVAEVGESLHLTRSGFETMNRARIRDLLEAHSDERDSSKTDAPVDLIPVVRVFASRSRDR